MPKSVHSVDDPRSVPATGGRRRAAGLAVLALALGLVYYPTVQWLLHRWSLGVWYQLHGFAVFPIAIWLAWDRLRKLPAAPRAASAWGFAFLAPAVLLQTLDALLRFEIFSAIALLLTIPGLCLLLLGRERTKAIWFPLLFLGFALPIPLAVARKIHLVMRHVAATGTEWTLDFLGYEVTRQGTALQVGPNAIEIADACSGFSTLTALLMVGMLLAYLARVRSWRALTFIALTFPIALLANLARVVVLIMLVAAFDSDILGTLAHPLSGVGTFVLALGMLMAVEKWLMPLRKDVPA